MSEPHEIATEVQAVTEGVFHWHIENSSIGGALSSSHAVVDGDVCVLVDPVQISEAALDGLPRPTAIVLTATCHQRSAWRYRDEVGAEVWLPEDAPAADEEPDRRFGDGDLLPGGLTALRTPGPEAAHYSFLLGREPGVLFCPDLLANGGTDELAFIPGEYQEDPAEARRSVERLLELPFSILCLDHGVPVIRDPKARIRELLTKVPAGITAM